MTEEQFYHQQINLLRLEYEKAIKPYLDRLAYLKKIEPPKPSYVALEEAATTPPQRTWVGLTDEERDGIFELHHTRLGGWDYSGDTVMYEKHFEDAVVAIEAKLKEKNT